MSCRALNVEHQFVKHVRESKRRVLCVIVGSAQLVADGSIHMTKDITGGDKVDVDLSSVPVSTFRDLNIPAYLVYTVPADFLFN